VTALQTLFAIGLSLIIAWLALLVFLVAARRSSHRLGEILRLLPDTIRLLHGLATDSKVPRQARIRLWLLFAYLAFPIDLIPDFIPVLGYADDAIIAAAVLRSVARTAGVPALRRNWPGTDAGFESLLNAAGLGLG
jgi:uncharacterized membrane protein YkvA (DUF1232 family)